jgi:hypothetical protein
MNVFPLQMPYSHSRDLKDMIMCKIEKDVVNEFEGLCSLRNPSILANSTPHNVINITDACIASELKNRAPTMERILRAAVSGKVKHTIEEEYNEKDKKYVRALSMATSILLRCRNPALSALSHRLSLLLWHGGTLFSLYLYCKQTSETCGFHFLNTSK